MKTKQGFTLVELLIVIALIGILAVAIVATLNPIEQVNRARDARYKSDASELLSAIERYYASNLNYPWAGENICGGGTEECEIDSFIGVTAHTPGAGVCGVTCDENGTLIEVDELKDSFRRKEQFTSEEDIDHLHIVKGEDSSSAYVCYIPRAGSNRRNAILADIWDGQNYIVPRDCDVSPTEGGWVSLDAGACVICAPEVGAVLPEAE